MGLGRIGNFVDGQIVGSVTSVWWGVEFPYADGFRHPVVLYDGAKNLVLMIYLIWVRRTNSTPGATAARFVFWLKRPGRRRANQFFDAWRAGDSLPISPIPRRNRVAGQFHSFFPWKTATSMAVDQIPLNRLIGKVVVDVSPA